MKVALAKSLWGLFKSNKQQAQQTITKTASMPLTKVRASIPGRTTMERVFGDKLIVTETQTLANGTKHTSTAVYGAKGAYIGQGDNGLATFREKTISRKQGESIFGGDIIEINKKYHDTMAETAHTVNTIKECTPEGIAEHIEQSVKYRHWEQPKVTVTDKTKSAFTGETAYSEAVKSKKAVEAAKKAEEEAILKAQKEAEEEAKKILPRVNTGKLFNKNIEDFTKINEVVKPDGTVVRSYKAKGANGSNQYIVTKDRGSYHEEHLVDTAKDIKIKRADIGNGSTEISMKHGSNYDAKVKYDPSNKNDKWKESYRYHDGVNYAEWSSKYSGAFKLKYPEITKGFENLEKALYNKEITYEEYKSAAQILSNKRKELEQSIESVHQDKYINLWDLFKPYQP